jgi:histidinol-phosphate phosphatase family protein
MVVKSYVVFDRDGILIESVHHLIDLQDVKIIPEAENALQSFKSLGFGFGMISNQSVIGRGLASFETVNQINLFISNYFKNIGIIFDFILICPHSPNDNCQCRKPKTGLGRLAEDKFGLVPQSTYYIGDSESDMEFAHNLGWKGVLISKTNDVNMFARHQTSSFANAALWITKDKDILG